jgi:hypothetical protein
VQLYDETVRRESKRRPTRGRSSFWPARSQFVPPRHPPVKFPCRGPQRCWTRENQTTSLSRCFNNRLSSFAGPDSIPSSSRTAGGYASIAAPPPSIPPGRGPRHMTHARLVAPPTRQPPDRRDLTPSEPPMAPPADQSAAGKPTMNACRQGSPALARQKLAVPGRTPLGARHQCR